MKFINQATLSASLLAAAALAAPANNAAPSSTTKRLVCNADDCLRAMRATQTPGRLAAAQSFCSTYTLGQAIATPSYVPSKCNPSRLSSACSCIATSTLPGSSTMSQSSSGSSTASSMTSQSTSGSSTESMTSSMTGTASQTNTGVLPGPTWPTDEIPYVDGRLFHIDGKTQYFAGTNTWWLGHLYSDADVETAVSQIVSTDLRVTRVWGFGNVNSPEGQNQVYYQILNKTLSPTNGSLINWSPVNGIPRLDSAIRIAEEYGLKVVLPMINNWDDLGGINIYTNAFGGNHTSFYTDAESQAAYRNWVEFVVNRYKSSPAIFAWELGNEPRCSGCDTSVIYNWAAETSAFIKSLDSTHMVTLGDEGWFAPESGPVADGSYAYSGYEGVDFVKNLGIPTLDYGVFHVYADQWGYNFTWVNEWIVQHDEAGRAAGKPVVFEEYGSPYADSHIELTSPWQQTVLEETSLAYDSFWQFANAANQGDIYALQYDTTPGSDYEVLAFQHAQDMLNKPPVAV